MDTVWFFLAGVAPSVIVFLVTALFLKKQGEKEVQMLGLQLRKERQEHFLPTKVEAYERLVLLLDRIHPNNVVMRLHQPGLPAKAFQTEITTAIREEFDHNVAQQLYITETTWRMIKKAKDETIQFINIAGSQMGDTASSTDLAAKVFELLGALGEFPTEIATQQLKREFDLMQN